MTTQRPLNGDNRAALRRALARAGAVPGTGRNVTSPARDRIPADPPPAGPPEPFVPAAAIVRDGTDLDDYDLAVLAGSAQRAVTVALVALRRTGSIDCGDDLVRRMIQAGSVTAAQLRGKTPADFKMSPQLRAIRPLPAGAHPLERTVYDMIAAIATFNGDPAAIRTAAAASPAIVAIEARLAALDLAPRGVEGGRSGRRTRLGSQAIRNERRAQSAGLAAQGTSGLHAGDLRRVLAFHGEKRLWFYDAPLAFALEVQAPFGFPRPERESNCGGCGGCG